MKNILISLLILASYSLSAQTFNPTVLENNDQSKLVQLYGGMKYGTTLGIGYNQSISVKNHSVWLGVQLEMPAGENILDDHREQINIITTAFQKKSFRVMTGLGITHRASKSHYVNMNNIAGSVILKTGFYQPKWHFALSGSFEESFGTKLIHKTSYLEIYPDVKNGWFNSSGGSLLFGIEGGYSFGKLDLNLQMGPSINRTGRPNKLPFYGILGVNWRI